MFGFGDNTRKPAGPPARTSLDSKAKAMTAQDQKIFELEMRIVGLEEALTEMCFLMKQHLDRIDHNTQSLDANMHRLAALTLRPPKDLLGGGQEPN